MPRKFRKSGTTVGMVSSNKEEGRAESESKGERKQKGEMMKNRDIYICIYIHTCIYVEREGGEREREREKKKQAPSMSFSSGILASKPVKFASQSVIITEKIVRELVPVIITDLLLT